MDIINLKQKKKWKERNLIENPYEGKYFIECVLSKKTGKKECNKKQ